MFSRYSASMTSRRSSPSWIVYAIGPGDEEPVPELGRGCSVGWERWVPEVPLLFWVLPVAGGGAWELRVPLEPVVQESAERVDHPTVV